MATEVKDVAIPIVDTIEWYNDNMSNIHQCGLLVCFCQVPGRQDCQEDPQQRYTKISLLGDPLLDDVSLLDHYGYISGAPRLSNRHVYPSRQRNRYLCKARSWMCIFGAVFVSSICILARSAAPLTGQCTDIASMFSVCEFGPAIPHRQVQAEVVVDRWMDGCWLMTDDDDSVVIPCPTAHTCPLPHVIEESVDSCWKSYSDGKKDRCICKQVFQNVTRYEIGPKLILLHPPLGASQTLTVNVVCRNLECVAEFAEIFSFVGNRSCNLPPGSLNDSLKIKDVWAERDQQRDCSLPIAVHASLIVVAVVSFISWACICNTVMEVELIKDVNIVPRKTHDIVSTLTGINNRHLARVIAGFIGPFPGGAQEVPINNINIPVFQPRN